ncbi:excinuclease ABC subunit UvrC [Limnochorda pilosa]|uniref:UvrABC system protein C n=1 Tax=Limnochorda pilosa TaxID=1555112 RepID=A0A0K2SNP9_LIMPI|nr:excinuclease ABC subunit UvrC [Limnochorda pilosa]BAS28758.1 excinuclease ABC subunit C [Limnochorda pilosa]
MSIEIEEPAPGGRDERPRLEEKLSLLPDQPGVYLMKNAAGEVIYVGKAVSLRHRVRSYFQPSRNGRGLGGAKVAAMVANIADLEYIVTDTEVEALILESNLIKRYRPWYNVRLRDDKAYPYIKVTLEERFPRVILVRRKRDDGGRYFGPYTNVHAVRETLQFVRKLLPVRTCTLDLSGELNYRPCLMYHIDRCGAPCAALQSQEEYRRVVEQVVLFLEGRQEALVPELTRRMEAAAEQLHFEKAARVRDQIRALQAVIERQKIVSAKDDSDQDVVGLALGRESACAQVFFIRGGKLVGREPFFVEITPGTEEREVLGAFLQEYYARADLVPPQVLVPLEPEDAGIVTAWLEQRRGGRVRLHRPQRGEKRQLVEMVAENARLALAEYEASTERRQGRNQRALADLAERLGLEQPPRRIECYDISNFQGKQAVASMVVLTEGEPDPSQYRRFKIQSQETPDDFRMMAETIRRRFTRYFREREEVESLVAEGGPRDEAARQARRAELMDQARFAVLPDLVVIDGGRGQLNAARAALRDLGLEELPIIGLAKRFEQIYMEDDPDPLELDHRSPALHVLQRVRDEAHRFAITYHRQLRDARTSRSALDEIEGVGPRRKRELLRHFGSLKRLREAGLEDLYAVPGLPRVVAERIYQQLH